MVETEYLRTLAIDAEEDEAVGDDLAETDEDEEDEDEEDEDETVDAE